MNEKNTDTLQQELMSTNNLDRFLTENDASFRDVPLQEAIQRIFDEKGMSKAQLAKQSGISEVYLHQLFSGRRFPSRSRLLCLCFGLGATVDEAQSLLQQHLAVLLCVYFLISPLAAAVRYALMNPSMSPSITAWMLPIS